MMVNIFWLIKWANISKIKIKKRKPDVGEKLAGADMNHISECCFSKWLKNTKNTHSF